MTLAEQLQRRADEARAEERRQALEEYRTLQQRPEDAEELSSDQLSAMARLIVVLGISAEDADRDRRQVIAVQRGEAELARSEAAARAAASEVERHQAIVARLDREAAQERVKMAAVQEIVTTRRKLQDRITEKKRSCRVYS